MLQAYCACDFLEANNLFLTESRHFYFDSFEVKLQYGVAILCYHLLPKFSSNQFEIRHNHIENMHVNFRR